MHVAVLITIYAILAIALDLAVAHAGMVSLAHVALCAIAAYAAAILSLHGVATLFTVLAAMSAASIGAWLFGRAAAALDRDVFAIATYAVAGLVTAIIKSAPEITGGPRGLAGIEALSILGVRFDTPVRFLAVSIPMLMLVMYGYWLLTSAPFGRALRAMRDDDLLARACGYDTAHLRGAVMAASGAAAGIAGFLYATYIRFVHPDSFTVGDSILVLTMIVSGGLGRARGAVVGASALIAVPEALRFIEVSVTYAANVRQMIYGVILLCCVFLRPRGLFQELPRERR